MENNNKKTNWKMIAVIVTGFIGIFGAIFTTNQVTDSKVERYREATAAIIHEYNGKLDNYTADMSAVKTDVGIIKTDILWIKKYLGGK